MAQKPFGLDIGTHNMKAVWLSEEKNGFMLKSVIAMPTPPKGMISESPLDQEEMSQAIRLMVTSAKITTPYVNIAFPESVVYTRVLEMPLLSDKELASAMLWEAEQHIPVPLETITLDWKILQKPNTPAPGAKMQVLLVGAPSALINKYQKTLSNAGLNIVSIETEIFSVIRVLTYSQNKDASFPNSIIVNIGALSTSLAIIQNGLIVFTYPIPTGGVAIDRALAADFGFSISQAEEYKKKYGISEKEFGGKISKSSEPILLSITAEVKKAQAFYGEKYKDDDPIRQILLTGGTAKLPGIDLFFAENCGVETIIADPWKILLNQELPEEIRNNSSSFTVSIGLAMRDYE